MKRITKILLAAASALVCAASCTDYLKHGTVDLTMPEEEDKFSGEYVFNHPCALVTKSDVERVKGQIALADPYDPVYASYLHFCKSPYAQETWKPSPVETLVRGDVTGTGVEKENAGNSMRDAAAAYQLALRWWLTDDVKYADAAVNILNSWAKVCKRLAANDAHQYLNAGFQGFAFANAAELLRDYEGWLKEDQDKYKVWMEEVWYSKNEHFIETHGSGNTCALHYWSNWELANISSALAIGIYLEDSDKINYVYKRFSEGDGSACINNMVPYDPEEDPDGHGMLAQSMESGRDQGHGTLVVSMSSELCQTAWNVGLDFYGHDNMKMLAMFEYTAKYNARPDGTYLCTTMPFHKYVYCTDCACTDKNHGATHLTVSADGRGTLRPCWDMIYAHYKHVKKVSDDEVYYVKKFADQLRYTDGVLTGDGGSGDSRYGGNSSAFDQIGWGTMMFYRGE